MKLDSFKGQQGGEVRENNGPPCQKSLSGLGSKKKICRKYQRLSTAPKSKYKYPQKASATKVQKMGNFKS
ncbi:hypothetical protein CMV_022155 [Castanea mollissima]|uniref:Uncharacterized protein n=1 Tax=Castanea mollissima TaxID=60419 RepID=A0A8J4V8C3_9ROSI|nr:hypothetical protein CMV_022155 [Castanea mollissima]